MATIKATVRNGRLEIEKPLNLPDGTELTIPIPDQHDGLGIRDEDWSNSPESIEAWIRWYDKLEPLEFAQAERDALEAARKEQKELEMAQWEIRSKRIEGLFP